MENLRKARRFEISLMNAALCMLVIFIHVTSRPLSAFKVESNQYALLMLPWRLSAFAVQGFIFLSGLKLFLNMNDFKYGKFLLKRARSVVLPYVVWVLIYYFYFLWQNYPDMEAAKIPGYILRGNLASHFYFIIAIVQFYVLAPVWVKLFQKVNSAVLLVFSLMVMIILGQNLPDLIDVFVPDYYFNYTDRIFTTYIFYFIAGCCAGLNYDKFKEILQKNRLTITLMFVFSTALNGYLSFLSFTQRKHIYFLENIHILYCISAILFFFMITYGFMEEKQSKLAVKTVKAIDRVSYAIYLSHCLVIFALDDLVMHRINVSPQQSYAIRIFVVYAVVLTCALLWGKLKRSFPILNNLR